MVRKPQKPKLSVEQAVQALLDNEQIAQLERYLRAGRRLARLDDDVLEERFIQTFKQMAATPFDEAARAANRELEMEFRARKAQPPYEALKAEVETLCRVVAEAGERQRQEDPAAFAAF